MLSCCVHDYDIIGTHCVTVVIMLIVYLFLSFLFLSFLPLFLFSLSLCLPFPSLFLVPYPFLSSSPPPLFPFLSFLLSLPPSKAVNYAQVEHQSMDSSSRSTSSSKKQKQAPPKPPKGQNESVLYSAVESQPPPQPPQDQMMYADLEHSSRGSTKGAPKDHARVEYSDVRQLH